MIPSDIKFDGNATPPQFTDNADQVIERGTHIRVKIKGIRGEVGQMYAIATIKEDYLGYVARRRYQVKANRCPAPCSRLKFDSTINMVEEGIYEVQSGMTYGATGLDRIEHFARRCKEHKLNRKSMAIIWQIPKLH